ncbi:protein FAM98C [Platysternon megacephalum]|uniref:Protein FAM98C n=1 Tax=Platysternon megacephalum TaxID=55544 RepID=A0A4D9DTC2_9SAUR|nr:protein FAM98C [Platysternon megacephalum]
MSDRVCISITPRGPAGKTGGPLCSCDVQPFTGRNVFNLLGSVPLPERGRLCLRAGGCVRGRLCLHAAVPACGWLCTWAVVPPCGCTCVQMTVYVGGCACVWMTVYVGGCACVREDGCEYTVFLRNVPICVCGMDACMHFSVAACLCACESMGTHTCTRTRTPLPSAGWNVSVRQTAVLVPSCG